MIPSFMPHIMRAKIRTKMMNVINERIKPVLFFLMVKIPIIIPIILKRKDNISKLSLLAKKARTREAIDRIPKIVLAVVIYFPPLAYYQVPIP